MSENTDYETLKAERDAALNIHHGMHLWINHAEAHSLLLFCNGIEGNADAE